MKTSKPEFLIFYNLRNKQIDHKIDIREVLSNSDTKILQACYLSKFDNKDPDVKNRLKKRL